MLVLLLLVATFLGEYGSSYIKKHDAQFSHWEYTWILTLGPLVVNIILRLCVWWYKWNTVTRTVIAYTAIIAILSTVFTRLGCIATQHVDRTIMARLFIMSIPMVLIWDVLLWNTIAWWQIAVVSVILILWLISAREQPIGRRGLWYVVLMNIIWSICILLFKRVTTYYTAIPLQTFLCAIGCAICLVMFKPKALWTLLHNRKNYKTITILALFDWSSWFISSLSYGYWIASIVVTVKRASQMLWSLIFGKIAFHENHLVRKSLLMMMLVCCVVAMQFPQALASFFSVQ